jgi:hypothetical protein
MRYTDNATTSDGTTQYSQEAFELAVNEAKDIAGLALGDFTRQMKPRYFTPPLLSVLTKFKQYSVLASYAIIRNAQLGLIKPFSTKELDVLRAQLEDQYKDAVDKDVIIKQQMEEVQAQQKEIAKEARRRLAGILGMTYLFGGYAAMPFFSLLTPILVGMLAGDDDDDDEFFNWENWFKNYMESEFGDNLRHPEAMFEARQPQQQNYIASSGIGSQHSSPGNHDAIGYTNENAQNAGEFMNGIYAFDNSFEGSAYSAL